MISDEQLAEIQQRCDRATPGPWRSYIESRDHTVGPDFIMTGGPDIYLSGATSEDQDFIAAAREDVPRLIAEVKRLQGILGEGAS